MTFKKYLMFHVQSYFVLVTLIFAASMIVGIIFTPEQTVYYRQLVGPFIQAGLCLLPSLITYFREEPTLPQYIIRHIIQLAIIEGIILYMVDPPTDANKLFFRVMIGTIVMAIYLTVKLVAWLQKYRQSKKLTEQLKKLQTSE